MTSPRFLLILFAFLCLAAPAAAQTGPVDADEAANSDSPPVRIGPITVTGSAWVDAAFVAGNEQEGEDTFRIRRGRIGLAGNLAPKVGWNVSAELTTESLLRNAFLVFRFADQFNVRVGQFTPPNALERGTSPLIVELIDRSRLTNEITYRQDIGISLVNATPLGGWISYGLSVMNGAGLNRPDDNDAKDVIGRIAITPPMAAGLTINASGGFGEQPDGQRTRNSLGVEYDRRRFKVMAEALLQTQEGGDDSHGAVVTGVYRIRPRQVTPHFRMVELAARYLVFTHPPAAEGVPSGPDEDGAQGLTGFVPRTTREIQAGANYYVNGNVRVMSNVIVPTDARTAPDASFVTRLQITF